MSISYSAITNRGKVTLPSVDTWGTNMNILRDPPKSIMTRRVNKVGETSSITEMIDNSENRACESILLYPRGINPFVSVSYSNSSNNGGQLSGGIVQGGQRSAKLPYTVMKDGAFRPPVLTQENLLPLSRMPRVWTTAFTKPGFVDFSKKVLEFDPNKKSKEIREETLKAFVVPNAVYKIEKPLEEPFEIKYVIQPTIKTSASSGIRPMDIHQRTNFKGDKETRDNLHVSAGTNIGTTQHKITNVSELDTDRYIQDISTTLINTNPYINKQHTPIDNIIQMHEMPIKENLNSINYVAPISGSDYIKYDHTPIILEKSIPNYFMNSNISDTNTYKYIEPENEYNFDRNMPLTEGHTNLSDMTTYKHIEPENTYNFTRNIPLTEMHTNIYGNGPDNMPERNYRLAEKINPGGFMETSHVPISNLYSKHGETKNYYDSESNRARLSRVMRENSERRYGNSSHPNFR